MLKSTSASVLTTSAGVCPLPIAGWASRLMRSRLRDRSCWTSDSASSHGPAILSALADPELDMESLGATDLQLAQELVGRNEERILLQDPPDDGHRVCSKNVYDDPAAKLGGVVRSNHRILVPWQQVVEPRLVLDEIVDAWPILERPLHVRHQAREVEALLRALVEDLLDESEHPVLVEVPFSKVGVLPVAQLESASLLLRLPVDSG